MPLESVGISTTGLCGDRKWMLVDEQGTFVSQRGRGRESLALVKPVLSERVITVNAPGMETFKHDITFHSANSRRVCLWNVPIDVTDEGDAVAAWFSQYLNEPVRLVSCVDNVPNFGDSGKISLINANSVRELAREYGHPIDLDRFRANLIVETEPFLEDHLVCLSLPDQALLRVSGPVSRCMVIDIDQRRGIRDPEQKIFESIAKLRTVQAADRRRVMVGIYVEIEKIQAQSRISAGDKVTNMEYDF